MSLIHDYINTRSLQQLQRLLDGSTDRKQQTPASQSAVGGKSWSRSSPLTGHSVDVNAKDWLGRTPLHLACASLENIEYVRALLKHPNINVNVPDEESRWTPLHRAMYSANLPAAQLLLQRSDIDITVQDSEGYTAFDVYNSTVNGTKPDPRRCDAELFTWGANRNAALGHGDGDDRIHPDQIVISRQDSEDYLDRRLSERFTPIFVRDIQMSKLHTAIVTSEETGNLRVCGFGSGGRLGAAQHTQHSFKPLPQFTHTITSIALGQDHTLALTKSNEVLSWGLNRFSQLGYTVETTGGKLDEPIQATPKKIAGPLKKEVVIGIAASKVASACWTNEEVFTWGTNNGQLGYDKNAQPVQVLPRKVTKFSQPIVALAFTDNAMVGLLQTQQVECIWHDRHYRINFPIHAFPSEIQPFRPRRALKDSHIAKVTSCGDLFAALSSNGEVFTFSPPNDSDANDATAMTSRSTIKPQRVWALRKKFSAVRDVALGADGSIIICTESGHVYTRIRTMKGGGGKNFKFQRVPSLQRITKVCANSTGAFAALRVDFRPKDIILQGPSISEAMSKMQPYLEQYPAGDVPPGHRARPVADTLDFDYRPVKQSSLALDDDYYPDNDSDDAAIVKDTATLKRLLDVIQRQQDKSKDEGCIDFDRARLPHGADALLSIGDLHFPVHHAVLAARSSTLDTILAGKSLSSGVKDTNFSLTLGPPRPGPGHGVPVLTTINIKGVLPLSLLILIHYLYSDEVLAIWDTRIHVVFVPRKVDVGRVKSDLQTLADVLNLPHLAIVLQAPVRRAPTPSLSQDMSKLFEVTQSRNVFSCKPDVVLQLKDREVLTYAVILRARSEFFANLLGEDIWTRDRWGLQEEGVLEVDLKHLEWHVMQYVLQFLLCGKDAELFATLPFTKNVDEVLEFMFEVMAVAAELMLDRLMLICSSVILSHLTIHNCCYILSEASHYHAYQLITTVQEYISANLECMLESRMLDDLPYSTIKQLAIFIAGRQKAKSPFSRTDEYTDGLLAKHWDWLELQDIPVPFVRSGKQRTLREAKARESLATVDATGAGGQTQASLKASASTTPRTLPSVVRRRSSGDDVFTMDMNIGPASCLQPSSSTPWKVSDAPRVDMRALMAEAQQTARPTAHQSPKHPAKISREGDVHPNTTPSGSGYKLAPLPPSTPTSKSTMGHSQSPGPSALSSWRQQSSPQVQLSPSASAFQPQAGPSTPRPVPPSPSPLRIRPNTFKQPVPPVLGMGPTFVPTKGSSSKSSSSGARNVSNGKAWTAPPPEPTPSSSPALGSGSASKAMSFAAIQEAQERQVAPVADRRTLKEIQDEEEAIQAEVDFMKWWQQEEDRVKQEMAALERFQGGGAPKARARAGGPSRQQQKSKGKGKPPQSERPLRSFEGKKANANEDTLAVDGAHVASEGDVKPDPAHKGSRGGPSSSRKAPHHHLAKPTTMTNTGEEQPAGSSSPMKQGQGTRRSRPPQKPKQGKASSGAPADVNHP